MLRELVSFLMFTSAVATCIQDWASLPAKVKIALALGISVALGMTVLFLATSTEIGW